MKPEDVIAEVMKHWRLVNSVAGNIWLRHKWPPIFGMDDAIQACWLRLIERPDWDPDRGTIRLWINLACHSHLNQLAVRLGLVKRKDRSSVRRSVSLCDDLTMFASPPETDLVECHEELQLVLAGCTPRQRSVMWRQAHGDTLVSIARDMQVSVERVRQIRDEGYRNARKAKNAAVAACN